MNLYGARIETWRERMRAERLDVTFVPTADRHGSEYLSDHDRVRAWLCGFTGSAGTLVVGLEEAALFTDGRYFIQAERELSGSGVRLMRMGTPGTPTAEEYAASLAGEGRVGVNLQLLSGRQAEAFEKRLARQGASLADTGDWAETLWEGRPPLPQAPAYLLSEQYAGRSVEEKLADIRAEMKKADAQAHAVNVLDDIAWTLNVRGGDVRCTPVVMSFLLIGLEDACWFVSPEKVSEEVRSRLASAGVSVRPYEEITEALRALPAGSRVLADPAKLTADVCRCIPEGALIEGRNPAMLMKAVKNGTELKNLREVHVRDGLALTRLMYWLKKNAGRLPMTELSVTEKLEALRREDPDYVMPSFETICAYGANAAMMHYSATEESNADVLPEGLLLIDSGGQYPLGATDVTRTFAMGPVPEVQKRHFTAVLESVLRLSDAKFLHGMSGQKLDILARGPIWDLGIDYRCGTGHGVGYMLCVHEGPNAFRWGRSAARGEETVLEAGMVTTDEPGIYIEGSHGIRTENELVCVALEENEYGQFMGFETITCVPIDLDALLPEQLSAKARASLNRYHAFVREQLEPRMKDEEERAWLRAATRPV